MKGGVCWKEERFSRYSFLIRFSLPVYLVFFLFLPDVLHAQTDTGLRSPTANAAETTSAGAERVNDFETPLVRI